LQLKKLETGSPFVKKVFT